MLYLEDFIVSSDYRNHGIGQKLYNAFISEAKIQGCKLVKWEVLDWNEGAIRFYERNGAIIEKNWWDCKVVFERTTND
jgi:GNAT superfamily N-acetyltransferase